MKDVGFHLMYFIQQLIHGIVSALQQQVKVSNNSKEVTLSKKHSRLIFTENFKKGIEAKN